MYLAPVLELSAKVASGIGSVRYYYAKQRLSSVATMQENDTKRPLLEWVKCIW